MQIYHRVRKQQQKTWKCWGALAALLVGCSLLASTAPVQALEEWEVHTKNGLVERRTPPVMNTADIGLPRHIEVTTEPLATIQAQPIEVERIVSAGIGGQPASAPSGRIGRITIDSQDHMWIAASSGVCRYNGQSWSVFTQEDGLVSARPLSMAADAQGQVWMSDWDEGITQFDGQRWIQHRIPQSVIRDLAVAPNGDVWVAGAAITDIPGDNEFLRVDRLYRFDGTQWWAYGFADAPPGYFQINYVHVDAKGTLWAGSSTYSLVSFDGDGWMGYHLPEYRDPATGGGVFADSRGWVWVGGVGRLFVRKGMNWFVYEGPEWSSVRRMAHDQSGRLWFIAGNGWGVLNGVVRSSYPIDLLRPTDLHMDRRENLWIGTPEEGLIKWPAPLQPTLIKETKKPSSSSSLQLHPNYPNPFNQSTQIIFDLPRSESVRLQVFNLSGQLVNTLMNQPLDAGRHHFVWDGRDFSGQTVASGFYVYNLSHLQQIATRKMAILR